MRFGLAPVVAVLLAISGCSGPAAKSVGAAGARRVIAHAASRHNIRPLMTRDLVRDRATQVSILRSPRTVFRYTNRFGAATARRNGVPANRHFTSRATPGRPLSPASAARRYGLPRQVTHRLTVRLPKGTPVKFNKALGGRPGVGEVVSVRTLPSNAVRTILPLRPK